MKINYMSDIHLEFGPLDNIPAGETLILAGDIDVIRNDTNQLIDWMEDLPYKNILYIPGNHEFYNGRILNIQENLKSALEKNTKIHYLHNDTITIDGIHFVGSILWSDFNNKNYASMKRAQHSGWPDYNIIWYNEHRKWMPKIIVEEFDKCVKFLWENITVGSVVITHYLPSFLSVGPTFAGNNMNGAFASNLDELILTLEPSHWIHGHTHDTFDYMMGTTNVLCNPRGYFPNELNATFDINACFEKE